jgi:hypothetical protein
MIIALNPSKVSEDELLEYEGKGYHCIHTIVQVNRYLDLSECGIDLKLSTSVHLYPLEANIQCKHKGFDDVKISEGRNPIRDDDDCQYIRSHAQFDAVIFMDDDSYNMYRSYALMDLDPSTRIAQIHGEIDLTKYVLGAKASTTTWNIHRFSDDAVDTVVCFSDVIDPSNLFATQVIENPDTTFIKIKSDGIVTMIDVPRSTWFIHTTDNEIDAIWCRHYKPKPTPKKSNGTLKDAVDLSS